MIIFSEKVNFPMRWVILLLFLCVVGLLAMYLFVWSSNSETNIDANISSIISGLTVGFIVACTQFLLSWYEHKKYDKFEKLGVINILSNKYNEDTYRETINNLKTRLWIMGNTVDDFLKDFADEDNSVPEKKILLSKLAQGIEVKILVANKLNLNDEKAKNKYDNAQPTLNKLKAQYSNFQVEYYDHIPTQSIFVYDNQCFIGPVFSGITSRQTPALHMITESLFAKKYIEYFENEWANARAD